MMQLLFRLFIKDYKNTKRIEVRDQYGRFSGIVGICTNLLLFLIKISAGMLFNSISITADAVNNLSDSASSLVTLVGFKMASKPADRRHPYGHARSESISGLIISIVIFIVGFQLAQTSVGKIIHPQNAEFSPLLVAVLLVSIALKIWQGYFYRAVGKKIESSTLLAASADSLNDVFATSAVLAGAVLARLTGFNLDGYMGLAVAVLIVFTGYKLIRETSGSLMGEAPSEKLVDEIYHTISKYEGVIGIHDLVVHSYGPGRCFASVHCEVPAERDILVSHDIIDNIEHDFLEKKDIHLVIHMDPVTTNDERTNALRAQVQELIRGVSPEISMHDFRVVWGPTHANLVFDVCVSFDFSMKDAELVREISKRIQGLDENYYSVITVDHDYIPRESGETKNS